MKRYFKDVHSEATFIEVSIEEFEHDMMRFTTDDFEGIDIAANRRVGMQGSLIGIPHFDKQNKVSCNDNDADVVRFWNKYSDAEICGSVRIVDFCDYYVVEVNEATIN